MRFSFQQIAWCLRAGFSLLRGLELRGESCHVLACRLSQKARKLRHCASVPAFPLQARPQPLLKSHSRRPYWQASACRRWSIASSRLFFAWLRVCRKEGIAALFCHDSVDMVPSQRLVNKRAGTFGVSRRQQAQVVTTTRALTGRDIFVLCAVVWASRGVCRAPCSKTAAPHCLEFQTKQRGAACRRKHGSIT